MTSLDDDLLLKLGFESILIGFHFRKGDFSLTKAKDGGYWTNGPQGVKIEYLEDLQRIYREKVP
jgi:hypothetical protein